MHSGEPRHVAGYRLLGRLGDGGQGSVYLGQDTDGTHVAVKMLHARLLGDARAERRFLQESAIAAGVAGFCTAKVLDSGLVEGRPYIVSEYIEGPSLHDQVTGAGPLAGGDLERLAVGTITALTAIHGAGIVHRDFKPSNILMGPDGPRVIDFGIAKAMDAATTGSLVVGTPGFMAPEQIAGDSVTAATDVFSWASTMGFAATGEPLFGRDSIPAVMHRILHADPDLGAVAEPLRAVLETCLSKDPLLRPSADDVLMRLVRRVAATPPPPGPPRPTPAGADAHRGAASRASGVSGVSARHTGNAEHRPRHGAPAGPGTGTGVGTPAVPVTGAGWHMAAGQPSGPSGGRPGEHLGGQPDGVPSGPLGEPGGAGGRRPRAARGDSARRSRSGRAAVVGVGALLAVGLVAGMVWRGVWTPGIGAGPRVSAGAAPVFGVAIGPEFGPGAGAGVGAVAVGHHKGTPVVALADRGDGSISVWDARTGKRVAKLATPVQTPVLSMGLATVGGSQTVVWTDKGGRLRRWRIGDAKQGPWQMGCDAGGGVLGLGTWRGHAVAVTGCPDGQVRTTDLVTHELVGARQNVSAPVSAVAWNERAGRPLIGTDGGVLGAGPGVMAKGRVRALTTFGNDLAAVTVGGSTGLYDLTIGKLVRSLSTGGAAVGGTAAGGRRMIAAGGAGVQVWNADQGDRLGVLLGAGTEVTSLAVGDGLLVAERSGRLQAWSLTGNA
nr:protein kinase [Nonomuraea sp. FMUSA5-5]